MCGRFASVTPPETMRRLFGTTNALPNFPARWNLAPTQEMLVVRFNPETHERSLDIVKWGLIPHWAKDASIAGKLINARAESLADKPSFRNAFRRRRCLVPADAYYEWKQGTSPKQPYAIRPRDGGLFAFAGVWENWKNPDGEWIRTATIVTTAANNVMAPIHDRMPAIIAPQAWPSWLGETSASPNDLAALMGPVADDGIEVFPVSMAVGNVRNEGAELLLPLAGQR